MTTDLDTAEKLCAEGLLNIANTNALIAIAKILAKWDKHYVPIAQVP
jgi:hypothetical protein